MTNSEPRTPANDNSGDANGTSGGTNGTSGGTTLKKSDWVWAIIGLIAVIWLMVSYAGGGGNPEQACKSVVTEQLKSPSSAKFSNITVKEVGDGKWFVTGNVESQNSFGGMVRTPWVCDARKVEGGTEARVSFGR